MGIRHEVVAYHDWLRPKNDYSGIKNEIKWRIKDIQNIFAEKKTYRILQREKPDIYHINVIYNPCGAVSAHELGIPVVWHLREFAEIDEFTPFFRDKKKAYRLISRSQKIICVSESIKKFYSKRLTAQNLTTIYDGIRMPKEEIKEHIIKKPVVITLSGGARVKGHLDLIRAAAILIQNGIVDFQIKIAGRFADEQYLNCLKSQTHELGLDDKIEFLGFQKDMNSLWMETNIAVVCSRYESFGLSVVEAMSRAVPVICANSTGTYEVTQQGKYAKLYDAGNIEQLAECIMDTIEHYESAASKAVGIAKEVRNKYKIEESCDKLISVFNEII